MEISEFRLENDGIVVLNLNHCFPCKTTWLKKILRLYNAKNNLVAIETMIDYINRELIYYQEQLECIKHKKSTKTQLKIYEKIIKNSKEQLDILKGYLQ